MENVGNRGDLCSKCGQPLDQQLRLLPEFCGVPLTNGATIQATVRVARPLILGEPTQGTLHLTRTHGLPVFGSDLNPSHGERIHLFLIDKSLADYHHAHPRLANAPSDYTFDFTAAKPGPYLAWAELRPLPMGLQEYARTLIPSAASALPLSERNLTKQMAADGLRYQVSFQPPNPRVQQRVLGQLRVTQLDGRPFKRLEPIMGAYAHLVGFSEDLESILHIHPKGPAVLDPQQRGGPELDFQFYATRSGFIRLFVQVQITGAAKVVPFAVQILP